MKNDLCGTEPPDFYPMYEIKSKECEKLKQQVVDLGVIIMQSRDAKKYKELQEENFRLAAIVKEAGEPLCYAKLGMLRGKRYIQQIGEKDSYFDTAVYLHPPIREEWVMVPLSVLENATSSLGAFCSDEGWGQDDMDNMDAVDAELAKYYARLSAVKKD